MSFSIVWRGSCPICTVMAGNRIQRDPHCWVQWSGPLYKQKAASDKQWSCTIVIALVQLHLCIRDRALFAVVHLPGLSVTGGIQSMLCCVLNIQLMTMTFRVLMGICTWTCLVCPFQQFSRFPSAWLLAHFGPGVQLSGILQHPANYPYPHHLPSASKLT